MSEQKSSKNRGKTQQKKMVLNAFSFATEFGFAIALPLVGLGLLGKWLDAKKHTNYFVLFGILLAIICTTIWISSRIKTILSEYKNKEIEK